MEQKKNKLQVVFDWTNTFSVDVLLCCILVLFCLLVGRVIYRLTQFRVSVLVVYLLLGVITVGAIKHALNYSVPGYIPFMMGFRERMQSQANIAGIRKWIGKGFSSKEGEIVPSTWPASVKKLSPKFVTIKLEGKAVKLWWGGGFGHWGLVVGPEDMVFPVSKDEFIVPIASGAYVWSENQ